jgi:hypothetical protein
MLHEIHAELKRVSAGDVVVSLDDKFEPRAGTLVKIELDDAYWHLQPNDFLELLEDLPADAGSEAVHRAIEKKGPFVWHGPSPEGSRDTTS